MSVDEQTKEMMEDLHRTARKWVDAGVKRASIAGVLAALINRVALMDGVKKESVLKLVGDAYDAVARERAGQSN